MKYITIDTLLMYITKIHKMAILCFGTLDTWSCVFVVQHFSPIAQMVFCGVRYQSFSPFDLGD